MIQSSSDTARCACGHPHAPGEWTACDECCDHAGDCRGLLFPGIEGYPWRPIQFSTRWPSAGEWACRMPVEHRHVCESWLPTVVEQHPLNNAIEEDRAA